MRDRHHTSRKQPANLQSYVILLTVIPGPLYYYLFVQDVNNLPESWSMARSAHALFPHNRAAGLFYSRAREYPIYSAPYIPVNPPVSVLPPKT